MARQKITFPSVTADVVDKVEQKAIKSSYKHRDDLLPSGSTLLNLALAENPYGGWSVGKIVNIIGDTHAGKTFLFWQMLAEMANDKRYDDYKLYYDDVEEALEFDVIKLFGKKTNSRVIYGSQLESSDTIESALIRVRDILGKGEMFVYAVDSVDALDTVKDQKVKDEDVGKRDYPDKPRIVNDMFRRTKKKIKSSRSALFMISQTRDKIGIVFGSKKRRVCDKPLDFFSTHVLWLAIKGQIKRKDMHVGNIIRVRISKNKLTGKRREVEFPIYTDYGIDDIESMIDWMVEEKFWKMKRKEKGSKEDPIIQTQGDFIDATKDNLIEFIENHDIQDELRQLVADCWMQNEEEIATKRPPRYS